MAYYAALVSVVQLLKDITVHDRYSNSSLAKNQLHFSLYEKFKLLQEMLDDYPPNDHEGESNDNLERRIRDAACHAQDIIESRILEKSSSGVERLRRLWSSTFRYVPDNIGENMYDQDLEKVKTEVDSVLEQLRRIKEESKTVHEDLQPYSRDSVQAPGGKNTMLVFDEDLLTKIKAQLCGESLKLEVISIAGMGGLGKTTLARNVFNDRLTHDRFDCHVWITVSQDYHLKNILLAVVNSLNIDMDDKDRDREEVLRQEIYKYLFGRRYLIIMDDVWAANFWDDIRRIFPDNSNGSRIMITTRLSDVADHASSSNFHHQMQFLDEDQSWTLLRQKVFATQEHCPEELEVIGKLIAKNCGGLPLAIVVIAGVLSNTKMAQHDWEKIARKVSSTAIEQNDERLSTILSLSYNHLPHHLKPCFLYLGGYPEDYEICISKLIRLWVAEGFLKPIESKSVEEAGEEYFKDLVNRNLVLITKKKSNGKFKFCIIHDVLRELCSQRARDENFLLCLQRNDFQSIPIGDVRRVRIQTREKHSSILEYIKEHGSHIRSLSYCSPKYCGADDSLSVASGCKFLRILDTRAVIHRTEFDEFLVLLCFSSEMIVDLFHSKITELLHLRYLNLLVDRLPVPPRISRLQNLQTLVFGSHSSLPSEIWKMPQLRHVISKRGVALPPIPCDKIKQIDGAPLLGRLQTLLRVEHFRFTSDTIEMIPSLRKLKVHSFYKESQNWEEYGLNNLVHLHQLETLYISSFYAKRDPEPLPENLAFWSKIFPDLSRPYRAWDAKPLPENFAFRSTLVKLTLVRCQLPWKDMSTVGSLPNLQVLKLRKNAFVGVVWKPLEGEFLKLKFLKMDRLLFLEYWQAQNTHFPSLEQLRIGYCEALKEIPPGIGDIPTLQLIKLKLRSKRDSALNSSALEIQQQQRYLGNDDLQVCVVEHWKVFGWMDD